MMNNNPRMNFRPECKVAVLHLRFEGRSRDIPLDVLDVGVAATDIAIKTAVARFVEVPTAQLDGYVVERHENGNLTLRPEAVFG